jgi:hypothetical protein
MISNVQIEPRGNRVFMTATLILFVAWCLYHIGFGEIPVVDPWLVKIGRSLIASPSSTGFFSCVLPTRGHGSLRGRRRPPQHLVRSAGAAMSTTGSRAAHAAQRPPSQSARTLAPEGNSHPRRCAARMNSLTRWSHACWLLGPTERLTRPPDAMQDHRQLPRQRDAGFAGTRPFCDRIGPVLQA